MFSLCNSLNKSAFGSFCLVRFGLGTGIQKGAQGEGVRDGNRYSTKVKLQTVRSAVEKRHCKTNKDLSGVEAWGREG